MALLVIITFMYVFTNVLRQKLLIELHFNRRMFSSFEWWFLPYHMFPYHILARQNRLDSQWCHCSAWMAPDLLCSLDPHPKIWEWEERPHSVWEPLGQSARWTGWIPNGPAEFIWCLSISRQNTLYFRFFSSHTENEKKFKSFWQKRACDPIGSGTTGMLPE